MSRLPLPAGLVAAAAAVVITAAITAAITVGLTAQAPLPDAAAPLFDDALLQDIHLLINSRDWETLKATFSTDTYYPADFRWRDQVVRNVGIRSRGNGSRSGVKPGLRIDFDRYSTKQKLLGLKSVVLRNNIQDPSHLHERLGMQFFTRMGLPAPRELHARLFVNNTYAGLYTVVEAVDRAFLERTFGEDKGYLFDYDYDPAVPPYYLDYRGADPSSYVPGPFKPATNERDPRPEIIERMIYTINVVAAPAFRSAIDEYLDVRGFVRYVAVETFLADTDGFLGDYGMNNYYLYRPPQTNQFTFIPWDKSHAFTGIPEASIWHNILDVAPANRNRLMTRLLEYPDLRELFLATLEDAARSASEITSAGTVSWLEGELDRQVLQIRDAVLADQARPDSNEAFEAAVESIRDFARRRPQLVMAEAARARLAALGASRRSR